MRKLITMFMCLFLSLLQLQAQNRTLTGKITDEKGSPIANASIILKGSTVGTTTDLNGNFSLTVNSSAKTLVISSLNYLSTEIQIGKSNELKISLSASIQENEEIVVVGYRTLKKKEVVGSISNVGSKEIAQKPIVNFTQLLQGKAAGVNVIGEGGRPGAAAFIRIRGVGSINASAEPLIIVDGIQIASTAFALINPNDIEDISILKDASSAAIYGSRAANGVMVVTTKRGSGKAELRYSFQNGTSDAIDPLNVRFMTAQEKLDYEYAIGYTNPYLSSAISAAITAGTLPAGATLSSLTLDQRQRLNGALIAKAPTNWKDYFLPTAKMSVHEVALSGSSDKFKYYMSANMSKNGGVMYGSYYNRKGGRLNVEYQANNWFKTGVNISVSQSQEDLKREVYNSQNSAAALYLTNPYEPVYNADGTYNLTMQGFSSLEGADNNTVVNDRLALYSTVFGEVKLHKDLTFKSQFGANYNTLKVENYLKPGSNLANILGYNQKNDAGNFDYTYVFTNTLNYRKSLKNHNVNLLLGQEFNKNKFYSYTLTARNFASSTFTTLENAGTPTGASTSRSDWALISYFANLSYDYDKKYYFNASVRRDGSSRFGINNKFANFWSLGAAWDLKKEKFLDKLEALSTLKLKASIGTSGNNSIGNYNSYGTYSYSSKYNDAPVATPNSLSNPNLTWETNRTIDYGIEFGFLKNRITGSVDYFTRQTDDLLYTVNVSSTTGFSSYFGNIGNLENKGIELVLAGDVIKTKDLTWNLSFNYTNVDNKITKLYSDDVPYSGYGRLKEGYPIANYFLNRNAGINPANGKRQYLTKTGALTETFASSDAVLLEGKSPNIKFYGSLNSNISYKQFDLGAQFYYSGGNYIYNFQYARGTFPAFFNTQLYSDAFEYWKKPGDITPFPNIKDATQRVSQTTDQFLEKGDYISLRDLTVGYTASNLAALNKLKVKSLRFYVQGTNLFIGTKFKGIPEIGQSNRESSNYPGQLTLFAYPQIKSVTVGLDVKF